ncbi:hypothetical protein IJ596_06090 [bacterium]|nr:hypothetical protein [bacterium]
MMRTVSRSRSPAGSVGEKFVDQSMSSADAELIMAAVDGIFALSDVFDAVTAIKALSRFKKLSKDTAEVLLGTKKSYKLLLEVEPELLDGVVLKLNQDIAIKLLSSNENSDFIKLLSSTDSNSYIKYINELNIDKLNIETLYKDLKSGNFIIQNQCSLSGCWTKVNESMSDFSRAYQEQITGRVNEVWIQNGVKFDGMDAGVLLDAKGKYSQFINKDTGEFFDWFKGKDYLLQEAQRQIVASEGATIKWFFAEEDTLSVVKDLFIDNNITQIELIFEPLK